MARAAAVPTAHDAVIAAIEADPRVIWLPIRHFSAASARVVGEWIRRERPVAVLVEGPEDATDLIPHLVHADTRPPVTVMSTWIDKKNAFGGSGVLTADPSIPARYRAWWPMTETSAEYQALVAGQEVGAALRFVDVSLKAGVPWSHVPRERMVASVEVRHRLEEAFFQRLAERTRTRSFDAFWRAGFELGAIDRDPMLWRRAVLTFAWCARNLGGDEAALEADGTLPRERHMRAHLDEVAKAHPEGRIAVVTGAFHTVALPWTRGKRATKADAATSTLLTAHSWRALSSLYDRVRLPAWDGAVWDAVVAGEARPHAVAARRMVVEVARAARSRGLPVSTADAVAADDVANGLAALRGLAEPGLEEVLDAVQSTFVKGDRLTHGGAIEVVAREVLVGSRVGRVVEGAGRPPLLASFYEEAKRVKVDLSGEPKVVRCDPARQDGHKEKSAFLHRAEYVGVPIFDDLERTRGEGRAHFRGADPVEGTGQELLGETWGIRWREAVDDRLVELSDRGPTLEAVAASQMAERLAEVRGDAAAAVRELLRCAQMRLGAMVDEALRVAEAAFAEDQAVDHLVAALADLVVVHAYRDALDTRGDTRVAMAILDVYRRACLRLPAVRNVPDEQVEGALDRLQTLVRVAATFDAVALDRALLTEKVREMVRDPRGQPALRGAGYGILYGFGAVREAALVRELEGYLLGSPLHVRLGAGFLDGLFATARTIVLGRETRLLAVVTRSLTRLDWGTFKLLLPELRRAFTRFTPHELDAIAARLSAPDEPVVDGPVPEAVRRLVAAADARAASGVRREAVAPSGAPARR